MYVECRNTYFHNGSMYSTSQKKKKKNSNQWKRKGENNRLIFYEKIFLKNIEIGRQNVNTKNVSPNRQQLMQKVNDKIFFFFILKIKK